MSHEELRELDRRVAEALGDRLLDGWWISTDGDRYDHADGGPRHYSTRIQDAWRVVVWLEEHCEFNGLKPLALCRDYLGIWSLEIGGPFWLSQDAETPEAAICLLFLEVLEANPELRGAK